MLVDAPYPSRSEATVKAISEATKFPIVVKYSEGGKSSEMEITTSGNKLSFSGKEVSFAHDRAAPITSISIDGNNIVFSGANSAPVFSIDKRTFATEVS